MDARSLPSLVRTRSRRIGPKPAVRWFGDGPEVAWTWADTWSYARTLALELLDSGLALHEPVVLWSDDHPEALFAEIGIQAAGGFAVRLPAATGAVDVTRVATAVGSCHAIASGIPDQALDAAGRASAVRVRRLAPAPPSPAGSGPSLDPFSDDPRLEERLAHGGPDTPSVALLPPGPPDPALGRMLVQSNVLGIGSVLAAELGGGEDDHWWIPGPWAGAFPRTAGIAAAWLSGGEIAMSPPPDDPLDALRRVRPSIAVVPAALARALVERAVEAIARGDGAGGRRAQWALSAPLRGNDAGVVSKGLSLLARAGGPAAAGEELGGRLTRLVASGPLDPETVRRLALLGTTAWTAIGDDVTSGVATLDRLPSGLPGSRLIPGATARRDDDGGILIEGIPVSRRLPMPDRGDLPTFVPWCRSGRSGRVDGDRVHWDP